jgi:hypothetical protein
MTTSPVRQTTLAQIVAVVGGQKTRTQRALTDAYHQIQRPAPFSGLSRTYQAKDDEGEQLPSERGVVQIRAEDIITAVGQQFARLINLVAMQDESNTEARGDIVVDGQVLVAAVPVTTLMWLEKQVVDLRTFVSKLPTLDPTRTWEYDANQMIWRSEPVQTIRSKKVLRNHVKAEATDRHPAQVETFAEDVAVGTWTRVDFSGALPAADIMALAGKVDKMLDAIRFAREQANMRAVPDSQVGDAVMNYLFTDFMPMARVDSLP